VSLQGAIFRVSHVRTDSFVLLVFNSIFSWGLRGREGRRGRGKGREGGRGRIRNGGTGRDMEGKEGRNGGGAPLSNFKFLYMLDIITVSFLVFSVTTVALRHVVNCNCDAFCHHF